MEKYQEPIKGRGAQINPPNPFLKQEYDTEAEDGLDEALVPDAKTELFFEHPKKKLDVLYVGRCWCFSFGSTSDSYGNAKSFDRKVDQKNSFFKMT